MERRKRIQKNRVAIKVKKNKKHSSTHNLIKVLRRKLVGQEM